MEYLIEYGGTKRIINFEGRINLLDLHQALRTDYGLHPDEELLLEYFDTEYGEYVDVHRELSSNKTKIRLTVKKNNRNENEGNGLDRSVDEPTNRYGTS